MVPRNCSAIELRHRLSGTTEEFSAQLFINCSVGLYMIHKTWQYICDYNSGQSWRILIILHIWKRESMSSTSKLFSYLFYMWLKYDVTLNFMTLMSCVSVCCSRWSSRWLMTQLTNGQHTCVLVFVPLVDILNIPCDCQFVFLVLEELLVSHHAWCSG